MTISDDIRGEFKSLDKPKQTTVYIVTIDKILNEFLEDDFNFEICLRYLSLDEQLKVRSKKYDSKKELINRLFTRLVLNLQVDNSDSFQPFNALKFQYNEYGKPSLLRAIDDGKNFQFNASTSNDILSMVIQSGIESSVGIDLSHSRQKIDPDSCIEDFRQIFDDSEYQHLSQIENKNDQYNTFNQYWTLKEAFTKLLGCGLNIDLASFWFDLKSTAQSLVHCKPNNVSKVENFKYFYKHDVDWTTNINIRGKAVQDIEKCYCVSGIISPIIISVISQLPLERNLQVIGVDMYQLLLDYTK
ncbi:hypothetical protein CAAN1_18S01024 [[Candida] anglica]|uniref:holo-[acyl-carrier-protein] synthase n=1 Tax=[Candida] anglica TaxID=148631 RepID=A0ABP0EQV5_9ASCO